MGDLRHVLFIQKCLMVRLVKGRMNRRGTSREWMAIGYQGWCRPTKRSLMCFDHITTEKGQQQSSGGIRGLGDISPRRKTVEAVLTQRLV